MAEIRVPFCATAELSAPFILDEAYSQPSGEKSVLYDTRGLKIMGRLETADVSDYGPVQILVYYVTGTIPYICNAYPIVKSVETAGIQQAMSIFNDMEGNNATDLAASMESDVLGWTAASGCVYVDAPVGGAGSFDVMPSIQSVTVESLAVANTATSAIAPTAETAEQKEEEIKRIVMWKGSFVITTA